ncbi:MAG: hypothetical protein R3A46_19975 [Thermomicrobiales bacterium]
MSVRITITDSTTTTSFLSPGHAIKMFVAACSHDVPSMDAMFEVVGHLDSALVEEVRHGLARFDEHNVEDDTTAFDRKLAVTPADQLPPFRVLNPELRNASLEPARLGLILFNLKSKRIVQILNHYGEINRSDRGRVRVSGEPVRRLYRYELSSDWALLP